MKVSKKGPKTFVVVVTNISVVLKNIVDNSRPQLAHGMNHNEEDREISTPSLTNATVWSHCFELDVARRDESRANFMDDGLEQHPYCRKQIYIYADNGFSNLN